MTQYKTDLVDRSWQYEQKYFPNEPNIFDRLRAGDSRPPVFRRKEVDINVLIRPGASAQEVDRLLALIPRGERHRWFGSMHSSQALAQSVFGNLFVSGHLDLLADLRDKNELALFGEDSNLTAGFEMEHKVCSLGQRRSTSLDGYISGPHPVAIECKFSEAQVGTCSRPRLPREHPGSCDGRYVKREGRVERCPLTELDVKYWALVPEQFTWRWGVDYDPCPLWKNYQLVRNILAVPSGHAVMVLFLIILFIRSGIHEHQSRTQHHDRHELDRSSHPGRPARAGSAAHWGD